MRFYANSKPLMISLLLESLTFSQTALVELKDVPSLQIKPTVDYN